ncbi:hypothetical protein [Caballeronia pedi]|uniref:hypothetical protein n=1 Tax=Caballeronia pedi TaxID=1777141 RepID=UPI000A89EE03|nr:hypothetical protein [Caballeronia pedi]
MSDHVQTASSTQVATIVEQKDSNTSRRARETSASAARTWAWGRTREPYDWMDAHTPSGDLKSWR